MQREFNFLCTLKAPKDAAHKLLGQIKSDAQAVRVSIASKGLKMAYYSTQLRISESYLSLIASGKRPVPEWFIEPFCYLSGTNLLKQFYALQAALADASGTQTQHQADMALAQQLRRCA